MFPELQNCRRDILQTILEFASVARTGFLELQKELEQLKDIEGYRAEPYTECGKLCFKSVWHVFFHEWLFLIFGVSLASLLN